MKIFDTLTHRLVLWFVLVGLLPLVLLGYLTLRYNEQSLRASTLQNLSELADKKALQIRGYFTERIADTRLIARSDVTLNAVVQLSRSYQSAHSGTPEYKKVDARYRAYFERYIDDATMFYDVFLIDLQGNVVYSQKHESDFATNLLVGPYRDSGLSDAFLESRLTLESAASTFEFYEPSQAMASFVAIPVIHEDRLLGVIAFQLDITQIQQVAADPIGLGSSGETVLARWIDQQQVMIVSPLKGKPEGTMLVELNMLQPVEFSKMPNPMHRALSGMRGSGIETDYRNQQVVAAWRYLPDLRFGMVVKMDADEAFASLHQQRVFSLTALLLVMLLASVAAYFFGRQISKPLEGLARTADEVAGGKLDKRADESAPGELGQFALAFNRMAENLQSLYRSLETRVEERTAELKQSMAELRIKDAAITSSINAIAIAGLDGRNIYVNQAFADLWRLQRREDAIGRLPTEFIDKPEEALAAIEVLKQQGYWRGELRALRRDGSLADLEVSAHIVTDESGKPVCMMASFMDITERNRSQLELRRGQDLLNEAQRLGKLGSWELNLISGELRWSDEVYRIFELDPKLFRPSYEKFLNVIHPDDRDRVNRAYTQSLADRQAYDIEHRLRMTDGRIKWVHEHCSSDFDAAGKPLRSVGAVQDITEQKLNEDQLRVASIAFETHEGIMITDQDDRIIRVNKAFESITGYSADEVVGHTPHLLSSGKHDQAFYDAMWQQITGTGQWEGEIWDKRKNGDIYPKWLTVTTVRDAVSKVSHYVGVFSDISQRKLAEEEIYSLAYYDTLTKLPNRRLLQDRFGQALAISERSGSYGVVLFLDLDKFKTLNDTLGHGYGDLLLIEVAGRIKACVREMDTVARMGGDEFVVLIEEVSTDAEEATQKAAHIAEKIRSVLAQPYSLAKHEQHSSPSIGVCLYRGRAESVESLLKHADLAMYQAKAAGRNTVCFFDPVMQHAAEGRAALEADLRRAVSLQQLRLYYQIQLDNEHRPLGAEALLRWMHPTRGMVLPAQFIPLAEDTLLILEIGHWVLESACRQLKLWEQHARTRDLTIAINVSAQQFAMPDFVGQVAAALHKHRVDPSRLKLELTESVVLDDVQGTVGIMHALKGLGVGLSMDDFGTGYSSLSYLKILPLDQLKIDQSFVRDITSDPNDAVLVQTIIDMARNFRLNVIAEGVETEAQLAFLKQHGCMAYQGYLFSKPVPIEEFEALLD